MEKWGGGFRTFYSPPWLHPYLHPNSKSNIKVVYETNAFRKADSFSSNLSMHDATVRFSVQML